jgi:hypothetical protein
MIEYLAPVSGGGGLQMQYLETDLTGSDFTKLNTIPLTIVPAVPDSYILPVAFQILHDIRTLEPQGMMIGDLNIVTTFGRLNSYFYFNPTNFNLQGFQVINAGCPNTTTDLAGGTITTNVDIANPIVLYATVDSALFDITTFKVRTFYYILPQ